MSYANHFRHADDVISHLNTVMPDIPDPLLKAKYVGFVSVAAVTVYEQAVKEIFIDFAKRKHKVLGNFTESYFSRINGKIKIKVIHDEYISRFGEKYQKRFKKNLQSVSRSHLQLYRRDMKSSYTNMITWRNDFAHEGKMNSTTTYGEVVQAYEDGKEVIHCLARTMTR
ncbi:HEPN domain-containing protein [Halomonas sp. NO4]|uniref:HEPN domain-containing protein n=1 Tax=Halomonas sp. NO4 TaxID=2484813 RepID=UPI0013D31980|nr:HEPN domain-containing protein [Halomonas sp. NO4]